MASASVSGPYNKHSNMVVISSAVMVTNTAFVPNILVLQCSVGIKSVLTKRVYCTYNK